MAKRVTDDDKAKFEELASKGYPATQIATETGWSADTVRKYLSPKSDTSSSSGASDGNMDLDDGQDADGGGVDDEPIYSDPITDLSKVLEEVLQDMGNFKENKIKFLVKAVRRNYGYQTPNGMHDFLLSTGVGGAQAKTVVEQVFGQMSQNQYGMQGGSSFNVGGYPQMGHGGPMMGPQLPMQWGGAVPSQQGWVMTPQGPVMNMVQNPNNPNMWMTPREANQITPQDVAKAVDNAVSKVTERLDRKEEESIIEGRFKSLEDAISGIFKHLESGGSKQGEYVEEKIPIMLDDGTIAKDPDTKEPLYRIVASQRQETSQRSAADEILMQLATQNLKGDNNPQLDALKSELKESRKQTNRVLEDLRDERHQREQEKLIGTFSKAFDKQQSQIATIAERVGRGSGDSGPMSDQARIQITQLQEQGRLVQQGLSGLNSTVGEVTKILGRTLAPQDNEVPAKERQWTGKELDEFNSKFSDDDGEWDTE